jgi:predicted amidohydrolase
MKVGILQFGPALGQVDTNLRTIRNSLSRRKFDLAVLPELAATGYNFASRDDIWELAEDKRGKSFQLFEEMSCKIGGAIVWGTAEKSRNKLYNSAILTTPEGNHHIYRKSHLYFREKLLFDPGNTGFRVFSWREFKIGLMICFDWIFPESARSLALKKAQIICHPSNLVMSYCQDAMITRSIENGLYCVTANRVGTENIPEQSLTFTGRSQITDPKGNRILRFLRSEQGFKSVKIKPQLSDTKNVNRYNHLIADRRAELYKF